MDFAPFFAGFLLGCFGQVLRVGVGFKKWLTDHGRIDALDWKITVTSIVLGGATGAVASLIPGIGGSIAAVAFGYAGSDALEGLFAKYLPGR